ncbi:amino acid permease [Wenzhouxiangella sp. XN79A]|uniref:APC family permease n=1 Tax=Wenzhouxiangella sp. XN79A TaxID=2724193 RepID=UPI00144A95AB|nr:APC family permease [Wenzhouxiangella sp. XN79A]NKI36470.1 amino acid permease [Wenzhouxiangella sp. XN79A]
MSGEAGNSALKREVGLVQLTFYGTGTILGAGIFVVIGEVLGEAGGLAPLAYLLAAVVALTTALSYSEMAARVPTAGGPVDYVERAFGLRWLGSLAGWALIVANVVSAATIITGFVAYLSSFIAVSDWLATILVALAVVGVAAAGMKESAWLMTATTLIGIGTLLVVLWALRDGFVVAPQAIAAAPARIDGSAGAALLGGAFLAIYSFIGFGDMAQAAEEVRDVKRVLPRAMLLSLAVVVLFYLSVSAALVGVGELEELAAAQAPLVLAAEREGWPALPIALASLAVIVNGALTQVIASSRLLFDAGRDGRGAPATLGRLSATTGTPLAATLTVGGIVLGLALLVPLKQLATATGFAILVVFIGVNASLIVFKRREQPDDVPDVPILVPWIGAFVCSGALIGQLALYLA